MTLQAARRAAVVTKSIPSGLRSKRFSRNWEAPVRNAKYGKDMRKIAVNIGNRSK